MARSIDPAFFNREVTLVARELLGATLLVDGVGGIIVETEAYHPTEPASHAFIGQTIRNASMFKGPGTVYIYRSYGMHWMFNIACADAAAVLVRALEPTEGLDLMIERRGLSAPRQLASGPGKLCAALAVTKRLDGLRIDDPALMLTLPAEAPPIVTGPRIGITKAVDLPWRFGIAGSPFLSRRFATTG